MNQSIVKISSELFEVALENAEGANLLVTNLSVANPCAQVASELMTVCNDLVNGEAHYKITTLDDRFKFNNDFRAFKKRLNCETCKAHAIVVSDAQQQTLVKSFLLVMPSMSHVTVFGTMNEAKEWIKMRLIQYKQSEYSEHKNLFQ